MKNIPQITIKNLKTMYTLIASATKKGVTFPEMIINNRRFYPVTSLNTAQSYTNDHRKKINRDIHLEYLNKGYRFSEYRKRVIKGTKGPQEVSINNSTERLRYVYEVCIGVLTRALPSESVSIIFPKNKP